jgi:hypothetical protein
MVRANHRGASAQRRRTAIACPSRKAGACVALNGPGHICTRGVAGGGPPCLPPRGGGRDTGPLGADGQPLSDLHDPGAAATAAGPGAADPGGARVATAISAAGGRDYMRSHKPHTLSSRSAAQHQRFWAALDRSPTGSFLVRQRSAEPCQLPCGLPRLEALLHADLALDISRLPAYVYR